MIRPDVSAAEFTRGWRTLPFGTRLMLDRVFRGERDQRLLAALTELHDTRSNERIDVAVVYGAAHVGDLVHALASTLGYRPRAADWLTVLDG